MATYPAEWLALREPADHTARNRDVLSAVGSTFAGRESLAVIDLACGTGSTLRACALALPVREQQWTLVDHDPLLLSAARSRLAAWADEAEEHDDRLTLKKSGTTLVVHFRRADLTGDIDTAIAGVVDLVTMSALLDLVSKAWIERLVDVLHARGLPLYAAITYNGQESWSPPHADDDAVHRAFVWHQRQVKAFGRAAGPNASHYLAEALTRAGYRMTSGDSSWQLDASATELIRQVAEGIASAAEETKQLPSSTIADWARFRRTVASAPEARTVIGHVDIFGAL